VELGRKTSLFELTESFLRLVSSKPIVSGSLLSLLKLAFSSSKDLVGEIQYVHENINKVIIIIIIIIIIIFFFLKKIIEKMISG